MAAWGCSELDLAGSPVSRATAAVSAAKTQNWTEHLSPKLAAMVALTLASAFTSPSGARSALGASVVEAAAAALQLLAARLDAAACGYPIDEVVDQMPLSASEPSILVARPSGVRVVWKPPGWEVTVSGDEDDEPVPGPGRQLQEWLAKNFGARHPIALDVRAAHGLVHRLDRDTSGALLWAADYK
ncbi:unnamed protein product, partial [Polarella glacialis]